MAVQRRITECNEPIQMINFWMYQSVYPIDVKYGDKENNKVNIW